MPATEFSRSSRRRPTAKSGEPRTATRIGIFATQLLQIMSVATATIIAKVAIVPA